MNLLGIPLRKNGKPPVEKGWQDKLRPIAELSDWSGNVGLVTGKPNNVIAVDYDVLPPARQFLKHHPDLVRCIQRTARGVHILFAGSGPTRRFEHGDIKGDGGYIVWPKSRVDGHEYFLIPKFDDMTNLAPFPDHLFPRETIRQVTRDVVRKVSE